MSSDVPLIDQVKTELVKIENPNRRIVTNIMLLVVTVLIFYNLGTYGFSSSTLVTLIVVIFIHEMGHLLAMKAYGYKDITMFFIPLLGAAVTGRAINPVSSQKAIVSLMGPVPGILLGIVMIAAYETTHNPKFAEFAWFFLVINLLNMLPIHPLDGARFFDSLLFSRKPNVEIVFKYATCLVLGGMAWYLKAPIMGIFTVMIFLSLRRMIPVANIAHEWRDRVSDQDKDKQSMPNDMLIEVVNRLKLYDFNHHPRIIALAVLEVWQRVCNKAASLGTTILLVVLYIVMFSAGVAGLLSYQSL
ncbi:MAG: site-2 protease family protein [Gammaproteobacteria bacterium]|nr:site-2 protease family protein [Gammaproteobacteria bacterium]MDH5653722.1 site-2 protease family protein [Gammaproteobacteria bacterium]